MRKKQSPAVKATPLLAPGFWFGRLIKTCGVASAITSALCVALVHPLIAREWTDVTGTHSTRAELISVAEGKATLVKPNGSRVLVPIERLSEEDRECIQSWLKQREELKPLIARLASGDARDRVEALKEFVDLEEDAAPAVARLTELLTDEEYSIRFYAARALARIGPPSAPATDALIEILRKEGDVHLEAMSALRAVGEAALPKFIAAMSDEHERVRRVAADIVGRAGDESRDVVIPLLADKDPKLREAGLAAFIAMRPPAEELLARCRAALSDSAVAVRLQACAGLAGLRDEALPAVDELLAVAQRKEESVDVRRAALLAIHEIAPGEPKVLPAAIAYLKLKDNEFVTRTLMSGLGQVAVEPLTELLTDPDPEIRLAAADALSRVTAPRSTTAIPALLKMLDDPEPRQRYAALNALAAFGPEARAAHSRLIELLQDVQADIRAKAIEVLAQAALPPAAVLPHFTKAMADESDSVAGAAARELGAMGPVAAAATPNLRKLTQPDEDGEERDEYLVKTARKALQRIESPIDFSFQAHTGVVRGLSEEVRSLAYTPDGKLLLSTGEMSNGSLSLIVWHANTGVRQGAVSVGELVLAGLVHSRDGKHLACDQVRVITLFDGSTGKRLHKLKGHSASVEGMAFSSDGARLASASEDDTIRIWDARSGEELEALSGGNDWKNLVTFLPDGRRLAAAGETIEIWDIGAGEVQQTLEGHNSEGIQCIAVSEDGRWLASGADDGVVRVWGLATGELKHELEAHEDEVTSIGFSADGGRLVSGGLDGAVHVWNPATGEKLHSLPGIGVAVHAVAFSPDGRQVASGDSDGIISVWSPK